MDIAKAVQALDASGIRKAFEQAARFRDPINLSIGQPDFDVPETVKEAAIEAIRKGCNRYTPSPGIPELRQKAREYLLKRQVVPEEIMVTSGVSGGLLLSLMTFLNPGDEILIPDPYFVIYKALPPLLSAVPVTIDTYPDFLLDPDALKKAITPRTKVLYLNNPSNPTGRILSPERLQALAGVLQGTGIWVITDEIYDAFDYEGTHSYFARYYDRTLTLFGLSKTAGMTGWRVGFAAGPRAVIEAMIKVQQYTFVCSPAPAQYAAVGALDLDLRPIVETYRLKRDRAFAALRARYECVKPEGAFYMFLRHPELSGTALVEKALEREVLLIPGSIFSQKDSHFRLSFACPMPMLEQGLERLLAIA